MNAIHLRSWLLCAAAIVCMGGLASSAGAITLPPGYGYDASQSASVSVDGVAGAHQTSTAIGPVGAVLSSPAGTVGPGTGSASGHIAITPSPAISASTSVTFATPPSAYNTRDGQYGANADYSGTLTYYFEIAGPTNSVAVNAKAVGSYSTSALPAGGRGSGIVNFVLEKMDPSGTPISARTI